ncbi:four helix bundle suffix domain-containing protein [Daejeonella rubra]|uniref:Four helix bundle suffix domain-containing protein n=1 Tax=Daejeonella rubra TaxID=990371 RepID=A0A1G9QK70_9SPHI|nr:four helix bundle suffix domain-containing protein [Daejeonella rubra]SDM11422.1 four helix bundle suffix domain-containing protein [Daejeonella rubra]
MEAEDNNKEGFIPKHGGYRNLITYQKSEIIYDGTIYFTKRFFTRYDRTIDQMVQAARSGKQNIVEASMASGTSKEMEIKLTNVARASLEELRIDYEDFLRSNKYEIWNKEHKYVARLRELNKIPNPNYETFKKGIENESPEICANVMIGLIRLVSYLLYNQIKSLEQSFLKEGGLRERMTKARLELRNKDKKDKLGH